MPRGVSLTGRVTGTNGEPVAEAVVVWGKDPYGYEGSQERRTDAKGMYRLPPLPAGEHCVTIIAKGHAPDQKLVTLTADSATADFVLRPGKRLRVAFVDETGASLPGVSVRILSWRGNKALYNRKETGRLALLDTQIPTKADDNGLYEWTWAPEGEVLYICRAKGSSEIGLGLTAQDEQEYVITMSEKKD